MVVRNPASRGHNHKASQLLLGTYNVKDYGALGNGGTDDTSSIQAAIDAAEAASPAGGIVLFPSGTYKTSASLTVESDGIILQGIGGHTGQTIIEGTHTTGPIIRINGRSCGVRGMRLQSDATRYAASVTDGHGIHIEATDLAIGSGASSLSRNLIRDVDIRIQPVDGIHNAGGMELCDLRNITVSDCKRHGILADNGTTSGRTNTDLQAFQSVWIDVRTFENGGNGIVLGSSTANMTLINCEGLGNCWNSSTRLSLYQIDSSCRNLYLLQPDLEDQQYAASTTSTTGSTRTSLATPGKGIYLRSGNVTIIQPHASSLLSTVDLAASVDNVHIYDPVIFAGTYATPQTVAITFGATNDGCTFRGNTDWTTGATTLISNSGNNNEIILNGKRTRATIWDSGYTDYVTTSHDGTNVIHNHFQTGNVQWENNGSDFFVVDFTNDRFILYAPFFMQEQAAANTAVGGFGEVWVRNDTPNRLVFRDDGSTNWDMPLVQQAYKSADTSRNTTTTLAADTHLTGLPIAANTFYALEAVLTVNCASAVPDFDYAFVASQTLQDSHTAHQSIDDVGTTIEGSELATTEVTVTLSGSDIAVIHIKGYIHTHATTAGTFALHWAQNTSDATDVTLKAGSWIRLTKLGP